MPEKRILIVGEVLIDTHLDIIDTNGPLVRLGGVFHSARGCAALGIEFCLAYYAPEYLIEDINVFSAELRTIGCFQLGTINRAPNVMLINESKESGDQGYYNIVKDQAIFVETQSIQDIIEKVRPTDILVYPGRYDSKKLIKDLNNYSGKIHIDFHYDSEGILDTNSPTIESIILSTSSPFFTGQCSGTYDSAIEYFKPFGLEKLLIKENRGGSVCYIFSEDKYYEAPSYSVPTMHSVGVGDVYNSVFISNFYSGNIENNMKFSSLCAAEYARTMKYDYFAKNVKTIIENINEFISLEGIRLPWADRKSLNIYLAAPDFPNVNVSLLNKLNDCLKYHNFNPRLPIRENGLVYDKTEYSDEINIYNKDRNLLAECDLIIAVLLFNDPGTLIELGMFVEMGKPTIIFDPYELCANMFARHATQYLCKTISETIEATFKCSKRKC